MSRPHRTALMPRGTVIEHDGDTYRKAYRSQHEPFPWTLVVDGASTAADYGDERTAHLLDDGGRVVLNPHAMPEEANRG